MKFLRLILLVLSVYLLGHVWFLARDGFSSKRILFMPPKTDLSKGESEQKIAAYLNQPYYYLGRGRQCYAFSSADNQLVIKIPRFDRYRLPLYLKAFNFSFLDSRKSSINKDHSKRLEFLLESFAIAEDNFSECTGVLYSHLAQTEFLPKEFVLYDALKRPFKIDLNHTVFAIQEKHPLLIPLFLKELKEGNREKAKEMLSALLDLLETRAQRGLFNKDARFLKNYSWNNGKSVQIDIGSFYRDPLIPDDQIYSRSFFHAAWPIREWLTKIDNEMAEFVEHRLESCSISD